MNPGCWTRITSGQLSRGAEVQGSAGRLAGNRNYIRFEFKTRTSPEKEQEVVRIKGEHLAIPISAEYLMHEAMHGGSNREELS